MTIHLLSADDSKLKILTPLALTPFLYKDNIYFCTQQFYILSKSKNKEYKKQIQNAFTIKALNYLSSDKNLKENNWEIDSDFMESREQKIKRMKFGLKLKLIYNPLASKILLDTKKETLIFDFKSDKLFGGLNDGENQVGEILMYWRKKLRAKELSIVDIY